MDRALNNRGRINEETKEQIIKVAKELNYKPNNIARQLVLGKSIKIAAVFPDKPERFFGKMINGMKAATEELQDFGVNVEFLHTESLNPVIEKEVLSSINPDDYDGIVIAAGGESIRKYIDDFVDGGTPVVTFNADVKSSKRLFFVGQDSYRAGRIGAELMGKFLTGEGFTAVLTGFKDVQSHQERFQGFFDCMSAHYSKINLAGPFEYYDDDETAYEITKQILTKHPNINGFFATSGPGAVGAGKAVKEKMPDKKIRVIGLDVNDETVCFDAGRILQCHNLSGSIYAGILCSEILNTQHYGWMAATQT